MYMYVPSAAFSSPRRERKHAPLRALLRPLHCSAHSRAARVRSICGGASSAAYHCHAVVRTLSFLNTAAGSASIRACTFCTSVFHALSPIAFSSALLPCYACVQVRSGRASIVNHRIAALARPSRPAAATRPTELHATATAYAASLQRQLVPLTGRW